MKDLPHRKRWQYRAYRHERIRNRERRNMDYFLIIADQPKPDEVLTKLEQEAANASTLVNKLEEQLQKAKRKADSLSRKISARRKELDQKIWTPA